MAAAVVDNKKIDEKALKERYVIFNERMKLFLADMDMVYGRQAPKLTELRKKLAIYTQVDKGRRHPANLAWRDFNVHRALIEGRKPEAFLVYDLGGLQKNAQLDVKSIWATATKNSKEAMWCAIEDLLDILDQINSIRRIPTEDIEIDESVDDEKKTCNA